MIIQIAHTSEKETCSLISSSDRIIGVGISKYLLTVLFWVAINAYLAPWMPSNHRPYSNAMLQSASSSQSVLWNLNTNEGGEARRFIVCLFLPIWIISVLRVHIQQCQFHTKGNLSDWNKLLFLNLNISMWVNLLDILLNLLQLAFGYLITFSLMMSEEMEIQLGHHRFRTPSLPPSELW